VSVRCKGITRGGERCRITNDLNAKTQLCRNHDPTRADQMQALRSKGGVIARARQHRRNVARDLLPGELKTMDDAVVWAAWTAEMVSIGAIDVRTAREVSCALREFRAGLEKVELQRELEKLQAEVKRLRALPVTTRPIQTQPNN
jgi:hypothetical protein